MPVACGNNRLARAHGICERTGDGLGDVRVRRYVEVGRAQKLRQLVDADEPIVEDHTRFHISLPGQLLQPHPVEFTLLALQLGMGRTQNDVDRLGVAIDDLPAGLR